MNKLPKDKRDKLLLVLMGAGTIAIGLYLTVVSSQRSALEDYRRKTDSLREKVQKAEQWVRMAPTIQGKLASSRRELEGKQGEMAPLDKFKWFYNTLEKTLARHRVKLVDITRDPEVGEVGLLPKFPYSAATFGVKLAARFHDFGAFLAEFENEFPYMRVQNVELDSESARASGKETVTTDKPGPEAESLAVTMRVVALIKPAAAF